ncbi:hypothetical protein RHMOL_Rhmol03G0107000 [Rhododendron molle]|uniref:Uncharacterized protein n=1 Tax=Rhododendron molle TaxID=49168 RepID=A0ACC0PCE9_RHOML|nr:hypothetical protein RHMOL_Rhmol03G0107000 [Rhododendron molle]
MKHPFLSNNKEEAVLPRHHHPWQWALCKQPKTLSFRAGGDDVFKTVNSVFFDLNSDGPDTPESFFTNSSSQYSASSCSTTRSGDQEDSEQQGSAEEVILRGAQSERLFFEPAGDSRSILKGEEKAAVETTTGNRRDKVLFKESSVVLAMESEDPYEDFKRSMEEMVESYGMRDWECLEELLGWYLRANGKRNHGFIVGAFVDLLVSMGGGPSSPSPSTNTNSCDDSASFFSAYTSFSSPCSSSPPKEDEITGEDDTIILF